MSDEIQLIKDKIDIAELVGEYIQLKPAGINKKGLCPFHHEKTPSFMVNAERQFWHCFGCGKGGDIFSFIQEMEGMEFREALKYLADRAGVALSSYRGEVDSSQRNRLKDINKEAARFFHNFLVKMPTAKPALDYLAKRGLKMETIEQWQIGYVPEQWELLTQYLLKKGFGIDDLVASGLTVRREEGPETSSGRASRGFWDRFRGRIMFPISNVHDEVVGFTGRILVEKPGSANAAPGKYINTPQTLVYDKSRVIFGLNKAKQEIKAKDLVIMVEGQMDVISCHQAGMKNVVASSGTALTEHQIKLLKRYTDNLCAAFDVDEAGLVAGKKGSDLAAKDERGETVKYVGLGVKVVEPFIEEGMNVKIIRIPDGAGKDPDECLKKNPDVWFKSVENAQGIMDWNFARVLNGKNLVDPKQKQKVANELLGQIILIPYAVERDFWLKKLAEKIGVEVSVLREDLARIKSKELRSKNNDKKVIIDNGPQAAEQRGRFELLIEKLLSLLLKFPQLTAGISIDLENVFTGTMYFALYSGIKKGYNINDLRSEAQGDKIKDNLMDVLLLQGEWEFSAADEATVKKEMDNIIELLKEEWIKKRRREMQIKIEKAEKNKNNEDLQKLIAEFNSLNS